MKITEQEAIAIARTLIETECLKVGDICRVKHRTREDYPERIRRILDHGSWSITFAYAGPPLTEEQRKMVILPPLDLPTTVIVNDETGEARIPTAL